MTVSRALEPGRRRLSSMNDLAGLPEQQSDAGLLLDTAATQAICGMSDVHVAMIQLMGLTLFGRTNVFQGDKAPNIWISAGGHQDGALVWGYDGQQYWEGLQPGPIAMSHDGALHCMADAIAIVGMDPLALDRYLELLRYQIHKGAQEVYP